MFVLLDVLDVLFHNVIRCAGNDFFFLFSCFGWTVHRLVKLWLDLDYEVLFLSILSLVYPHLPIWRF
jgi:hypothetical protein